MARYTGVGLTATFSDEGESPNTFTFPITSFSFSEGDTPQVDITGAADPKRVAVPGIEGIATGSITGIYEGVIPDWFRQCSEVGLLVQTRDADCETQDVLGVSSEGSETNYMISIESVSVETSMDEAMTITVGFFSR